MTEETAPLLVTVFAPDGRTPVAQAGVRVYGFVAPGQLGAVATGQTDANGVLELQVAPGQYCVSVRTAPEGWEELNIIAPGEPKPIVPVAAAHGPVVRGRRTYVPFTPANFQYCYEELPVRVNRSGGRETVAMVPALAILPEVLGLDGTPLTGVDVYAVLPVDVPWGPPLPEGVKRAFLSTFDQTASPADLIVSEGAPFALEFQQPFGQFNITGTAKGVGGRGAPALAIEAAPLLCTQTMEQFPAGEVGIDFTKVNYGYHADPGTDPALVPDLGTVALQLIHSGEGAVTITLRTDLPQGRWTTTVDYACADGECGGATSRFSGGNTQVVHVYHMQKPDGSVKTTVVLTGIPAGHTAVLFAAKSPGDAVPLASRDVATDAFFVVPRPAKCVIELSNDDKWAVGDI